MATGLELYAYSDDKVTAPVTINQNSGTYIIPPLNVTEKVSVFRKLFNYAFNDMECAP